MASEAGSTVVSKLLRLFGVVAVAILVCAAFGALHNQVSYTISPDYFHAFKFWQFDVAPILHNRVGASLVGVGASWWMGVPLGLIVGIPSMLQPTWRGYVRATAFSILAILIVTVAFGALGVAIGASGVVPAPSYVYPDIPIHNPQAFAIAGTMHDLSYLGAALGLAPALLVQGLVWRGEVRRRELAGETSSS